MENTCSFKLVRFLFCIFNSYPLSKLSERDATSVILLTLIILKLFTEPNDEEAQIYINQLIADGNIIPVDEDVDSYEVVLPVWFDPDKFKRYFFLKMNTNI